MAASKKLAAAAATNKVCENPKIEKANVKNVKKVGTVRAKPTKAAVKSATTKLKSPKAKSQPKKAIKRPLLKKITVGKK